MVAAGWALETPWGSDRCGPWWCVIVIQTSVIIAECGEIVGVVVGVLLLCMVVVWLLACLPWPCFRGDDVLPPQAQKHPRADRPIDGRKVVGHH